MADNEQRAVIWDLDGVLANTAEAHFVAWVTALAEIEVGLDRATFGRVFGMDNRDTLTQFLGRSPTPEEWERIIGRKEYLFQMEAQRNVRPFPGVLALMEDLNQDGWQQALASSAPWANIHLLVDKFGIRRWLAALCSGEDVPASKPDPALFITVADALQIPPMRCLVVEDAPVGVAAAKRAGMKCLAVATTRPRSVLSEADLVLDDLKGASSEQLSKLLQTGI